MTDTCRNAQKQGFTLIELLVVIAIIGILSSVVVGSLLTSRDKAYVARAQIEFRSMNQARELYRIDYGGYPADVDRGLPPGLEAYIGGHVWPEAPWPGAVYDWDNWDDPDVSGEKIVQFSIRFCDAGETDLENCVFPKEDWADDFGVNSAVYYCVYGNCRSHENQPADYPGYCLNCND